MVIEVASDSTGATARGPVRGMRVFRSAEKWSDAFGEERKGLTQRAQRGSTEGTETEGENPRAQEGVPFEAQGKPVPRELVRRRGSVIAIGNFDGIHLGHQKVLEYCIAAAAKSGAVATALTFEPAPLKVLRPEVAPLRISTNEQRMNWFEALGMEAAVVLPFTLELSRVAAEDFVNEILVRQLHVKTVVVGEDFRFGHKQSGNVKLLREWGMRDGFEVVVHEPVMVRGEIVSSTRVRKLIAEGKVTQAGRLLGRPFALTGEVVKGTGTGSKFTFPTLNLRPEQELLPAKGVYVTRTVLDGELRGHRSVTNVGMRPTFDGTALTVETHLLGLFGDHLRRNGLRCASGRDYGRRKSLQGRRSCGRRLGRILRGRRRLFRRLRRARKMEDGNLKMENGKRRS